MSIIEQIPSVTYKGNGTQTRFDFPFPILAEENLSVSIFNTLTKVTTPLELGTDYDVVVENNEYPAENGYIIYMYKPTGEGLPEGCNLTIDRTVPYEQPSVYPPNTLLNPEQIEDDLDNLEMQIQQLNLKDGRLITIPPGYEGTTDDYLEEFWDAVQNGGEQALNAADRAEDAADRAEDAASDAEAWAKEQGLWEMDDNNDLFPIENTPITADDDWELDENGDIMPRGTVESLQYPTHVRVVDVFSKLQGLNLKTGQLVMTQGFYEPADGGGASYVCVDSLNEDETADGYGIIALNNGKYLKLRHNGVLNVKWFGAKGDGVTDDTEAIQRTIDYGGVTLLVEGDYLISNTLNINIMKTTFKGYNSRCQLIAKDTFPENSFMLSFYNPGGNNWIYRDKRTQRHGGFSLIGVEGKKINGISTSKDVGESGEGHCDCQEYETIVFKYLYKAFEYGSHVYRCICKNLIFNTGITYAIITTDTIADSGEAMLFISCSVWSGRIYLRRITVNFISCTIHLQSLRQTEDFDYGEYFYNTLCVFTNCHFELMTYVETSTYIYNKLFYGIQSSIHFNNCFWIAGSGFNFSTALFVSEQDSFTSRTIHADEIVLNDCDIKYFLQNAQTTVDENNVEYPITKGKVYFLNTGYVSSTIIGGNYLEYWLPPLYEHESQDFTINSAFGGKYYYVGDMSSDNTIVTEKDTYTEIKVNIANTLTTEMQGIYKRRPVGNHRIVNYKLTGSVASTVAEGTYLQIFLIDEYAQSYHDSTPQLFGIFFTREDGTLVYPTKSKGSEYVKSRTISKNLVICIPPDADYVYYGVGILTNAQNFAINISKCSMVLL